MNVLSVEIISFSFFMALLNISRLRKLNLLILDRLKLLLKIFILHGSS